MVIPSTGERASFRNPLPGRLIIPTSSSRVFTKGIKINLLVKSNVLVNHLSGILIFKGITVIEWFLLHEFVSRNLKSPDEDYFASLCGILKISASSRKGELRDFCSRTRPIHRVISGFRFCGQQLHGGIHDLVEFLGIPKKTKSTKELYTFRQETWKNPRPLELNRMGIGYRDKGSLGPEILELSGYEEITSHKFVESNFLNHWTKILKC
jgi:hypothetical protein